MRKWATRLAVVSAGGVGLGVYAHMVTRQSSNAPPKCAGPELSAEKWNELQDQQALARTFQSLPALRQSGVLLHLLLGCPYCAKVRATLDFYDVPYTPVVVDPVNFQELNPIPYKSCPQVQILQPVGGVAADVNEKYPVTKKGPFVADSEAIISRVTKAAGVDITKPEIATRREWITRDVSRLVFVSGSQSFKRAFDLWPYVTPEKYHGLLFRFGGAIPMWLLAKYKITGRLTTHYDDAEVVKNLAPEVAAAAKEKPFNADVVLAAELKDFGSRYKPFHGGAKPDQVDVELFGLLRSQVRHRPISAAIHEGGLDEWYAQMELRAPSRALTGTETR